MVHRSLVLGVPLLAGLSALTGCVAPAEDVAEPVSAAGQAIMGGKADPGDLNVVDIVWQSSQGFSECSGSLLAPNMVLTAHHCVANILNGDQGVDCSITSFASPDVPSHFLVSTKEFLSMNAADYHKVKEVVLTPAAPPSKICGVDQAILILADNVDPSEAVPLVPRVDVPLAAKEKYTAIGFGITSDTANDSGTRRRLDGLTVDCVGKGCASIAGGQISTAHEWLGDHGTCEGDSGGPALDTLNRVVGVTSRGGANCSTPIYGDVQSWGDWIKQTAQHAADVGGYTAPSWVTGWPTDPAFSAPIADTDSCASATCASNICLADDAGSYCTRQCEDAAPCPDGYTCETIDSSQICQRVAQPAPAPKSSGGCSVQPAEPTRPVPWSLALGLSLGALAVTRRRRRAC